MGRPRSALSTHKPHQPLRPCSATAWAEPEEFDEMGTDLVARLPLELFDERLYPTIIEMLHRTTTRTDEVVAVCRTDTVAMALVETMNALE